MADYAELKASLSSLSREELIQLSEQLLTLISMPQSGALEEARKGEIHACLVDAATEISNGTLANVAFSKMSAKLGAQIKFESAALAVFETHAELMRKLSE